MHLQLWNIDLLWVLKDFAGLILIHGRSSPFSQLMFRFVNSILTHLDDNTSNDAYLCPGSQTGTFQPPLGYVLSGMNLSSGSEEPHPVTPRAATSRQPDEPDIIRRALLGDQAGWESLVHAHQEPVFRLAYLLLGSRDEAEDVAQETFIRAYKSLHRFDIARPLRPWLLKIAANLARNRRRSAGRYLSALNRLVDTQREYTTPSAESQSAQRLQANALWGAVRKLGVADQQVIYLRYFLELTVEETADATGVAQGTIKSRLHRALSRLREVIEMYFPELGERSSGRQNA
jgi:RNA polymerase sigma-70 factor (ECF subfamily)